MQELGLSVPAPPIPLSEAPVSASLSRVGPLNSLGVRARVAGAGDGAGAGRALHRGAERQRWSPRRGAVRVRRCNRWPRARDRCGGRALGTAGHLRRGVHGREARRGRVSRCWLGIRTLLSSDDRIGGRQAEPTLGVHTGRASSSTCSTPRRRCSSLPFCPSSRLRTGSTRAQLALLGAIFVAIALTSDLMWALVAGTASEVLRHSRAFLRAQRYVSGTVFIGLGALAAVTRRDGA